MIKIRYNAPVTLTFALISTIILGFDSIFKTNIIYSFFTVPGKGGFDSTAILSYIRLFTHAAGHENWVHLFGNFSFILLLGPILEEKYGSPSIFFMMVLTALITGILNILLFTTGLMGASGIVFMMILLVSFTNIRSGEIPLTFILVVILFLARELIGIFRQDNNISEFAHIIGGVCGSLFGFMRPKKSG